MTPEPGPAAPDARDPYPLLPQDLPRFDVRLTAPDLAPWQAGTAGIPGFVTHDSGRRGPHLVLISLIHGNEIAGAIVLDRMLRSGATPSRGKITYGFANLAAFARFDAENPIASRFVEEDMNRVWDDAQLFGVRRSLELDRAREMRRVIDSADVVLDLHSMLWPSDPLLLCGQAPAGRRLAMDVATPPMVVADKGHAGGKRLIDYGRFTEAASPAACILVEAGQHWQPDTVAQMEATTGRLLAVCGMAAEPAAPVPPPAYAEVNELVTARTNRFAFVKPFRGGEIIGEAGTLIAHDGDAEIRTPHDNCLLVMPSLRPSRGHTAIRLARIVAPAA